MHKHQWHPTLLWCTNCGVTQKEVFVAPRDSILWTECHKGLPGRYLRQIGKIKRYETRRIM